MTEVKSRYFWVKPLHDSPWMPAETVNGKLDQFWLIGEDYESTVAVVGPEIFPPVER